jgi:hypothetical protein
MSHESEEEPQACATQREFDELKAERDKLKKSLQVARFRVSVLRADASSLLRKIDEALEGDILPLDALKIIRKNS